MKLEKIIKTFPTKYKKGYTSAEIEFLLYHKIPQVDSCEFNENLGVTACILKKDELIVPKNKVLKALKQSLKNQQVSLLATYNEVTGRLEIIPEEVELKVNAFKSRHKEGLLFSECEFFLNTVFPGVKLKKFNKALGRQTCLGFDGEPVIFKYHVTDAVLTCLNNMLNWCTRH